MWKTLLAVYPTSAPARERCRRILRESFGSVSDRAGGWLVSSKQMSGSLDGTNTSATEFVWEGDQIALRSAVFSESLNETLQRLVRFTGDAGFAQLRPDGSFLAARSCSGLVALYFCRDLEGTWISTSFQELARCRAEEPRRDALVQALWAEGWSVFPEGRTFVEGIQIVPRGGCLLGNHKNISIIQYWDPRPSSLKMPSESAVRAHVEELRDALLEAVGTLDRRGLNLLTLSGGVDSSALAYLAHSLGFPLATLTFVAPRGSAARAHQLTYVDGLVQDLGVQQTRRIDAEDVFLNELFQQPLPALYFCPHPALRLLPELSLEFRPKVLFSGHFADEVCGHSQRLQDWIQHTSLRTLLDPRYPHPTGLRDVARWGLRRTLETLGKPLLHLPSGVGTMFNSSIREEAAEWCQRERKRVLSDRRPLRELATWCSLDGWIAMHWECCTAWGIRPMQPFFTRRILELAFKCHPSELFGPGNKKILRGALGAHVPGKYLDRTDKGHWRAPRAQAWSSLTSGQLGITSELLADEYQRPGRQLTRDQHRQLNQIVLFATKLRETRHAGTGKI